MKEIVNKLHENRQIQLAKEILESNGYKVEKISESSSSDKEFKAKDGNRGSSESSAPGGDVEYTAEDVDINKFISTNGGVDRIIHRSSYIMHTHPHITLKGLAEILSDDDEDERQVSNWMRALEYLGIADDLEESLIR